MEAIPDGCEDSGLTLGCLKHALKWKMNPELNFMPEVVYCHLCSSKSILR